jgi:hypothetical protein
MLNTFIRLTPVSYCTEQECQEDEQCFSSAPVYELALPAKPSDVIAWIEDKESADFWAAEHLRIGLADSCGNIVVEDIGTVEESDSQYYFSATIPSDTVDGGYTLVIYRQVTIEVFSFTPNTGPCDGSITFEIPNEPAESFEWSLDGETFQESSTFSGLCFDGIILVYVRVVGESCISGETEIDATPGSCIYDEPYLADLADDYLYSAYNCYLNDVL